MTLNAEKCTLRMTKVVFMGLLLTRHGIGPTHEKVRVVVEASQPQSPSELRSFLGLVGFSARFIPDFSTTAEPLSWHTLTKKLAPKSLPMPVRLDLELCLYKKRMGNAVPFVLLVVL